MPKVSLSGMTVEALMDLRKRVDEMLLEHRAEIAQQLEKMERAIALSPLISAISPLTRSPSKKLKPST